jgi:hypothetical protein
MKKIIKGKMYDTDTATQVGEHEESYPTEFDYVCEVLYRKRTGEYFVHGRGNAASRYAQPSGLGNWGPGERIMPYTYEQARQWAEDSLGVDEYQAEFGEVAEDDSQVQLSCMVSAQAMTLIRRKAQRDGTTIAAVVEQLAMSLTE